MIRVGDYFSVLFDDDGQVYVVWGYDEIRFARLNDDLTDLMPDTERILIPKGMSRQTLYDRARIDERR